MTEQGKQYYRVYAQVDLDAIRQNVRALKGHIQQKIQFCAVIKANGYGHGATAVAQAVEADVDMLAVATAEEAQELRESGIRKPILILSYVHPSYYPMLIKQDIRPTLIRPEDAKKFSEAAVRAGKEGVCHIAVDTGMSRIGFVPDENSAMKIAQIAAMPGVRVEGIFTHFARSDERERSWTEKQFVHFARMKELLAGQGVEIALWHCSNSAAILDYAEYGMNMVRAGIVMYGIYPSDDVNHREIVLKPAMQLKSHVILIKEVAAGTQISYGGTYTAPSVRRIATVPVGYGDGYPRLLSNRGSVLIRGRRAPIVGRVCMDQMMIDVTEIEDACEGDIVTLMGRDAQEEITADELAGLTGTISYEIICGFGARVPRVYGS